MRNTNEHRGRVIDGSIRRKQEFALFEFGRLGGVILEYSKHEVDESQSVERTRVERLHRTIADPKGSYIADDADRVGAIRAEGRSGRWLATNWIVHWLNDSVAPLQKMAAACLRTSILENLNLSFPERIFSRACCQYQG